MSFVSLRRREWSWNLEVRWRALVFLPSSSRLRKSYSLLLRWPRKASVDTLWQGFREEGTNLEIRTEEPEDLVIASLSTLHVRYKCWTVIRCHKLVYIPWKRKLLLKSSTKAIWKRKNRNSCLPPTFAYPNPPGQALVSLFDANNFNPGGFGSLSGWVPVDRSGHGTAITNNSTSDGAVTPSCSPFPMMAGLKYRKLPGWDFGSHPVSDLISNYFDW